MFTFLTVQNYTGGPSGPLCARFDALERQGLSYYSGGANEIEDDDGRGEALDPLTEEQALLLDRIAELRATTFEGFQALASSAALYAPDLLDGGGDRDDLVRTLFRSVAAMQS